MSKFFTNPMMSHPEKELTDSGSEETGLSRSESFSGSDWSRMSRREKYNGKKNQYVEGREQPNSADDSEY